MLSSEIVKKILENHKTPFYVFEQKGFTENYLRLQNEFRKIYSNYHIAYSYKTNYTPYILKLIKTLGGYAEIVSDMEYKLAKELGYTNGRIIYNGPCKGDLLKEHLLMNGISNIDNYDEALEVIALAKRNPQKQFRVGLRINSDIGANYVSRFGLELNSEELERVVKELRECNNIAIKGIHCHVSCARGLDAWEKRICNMIYAADKYVDGIPDYIDVGSGMFGEMDDALAVQFGEKIPTYADYASIVAQAMAEHYSGNDKPVLFSEPGTTVVAKYLSLVTSVKQKKTISNKTFVTVDSSYYNTGEICLMKKLPYFVLSNNKSEKLRASVEIMGFTCLEQDCIYHDFPEAVEPGDIIVFGNVGGYSIVSKPPFIQPNCPMLVYSPGFSVEEIKRQETYEDVFRTFSF